MYQVSPVYLRYIEHKKPEATQLPESITPFATAEFHVGRCLLEA